MSDNQFDFGPAAKQIESLKGAANGLASLDSNGLVPSSQLPGATQSVAGLMSAADKTKLDGIATGATANVVSDSLSDTSTTNALSAAKGKALNDSVTTLNTQIGTLTSLTTSAKTNIVAAINELVSSKTKIYVITNIDAVPASQEYSLGFALIDNTGYFQVNMLWISLQLKVGSNTLARRIKYGNTAWTAWASL